MKAFVSSFLDKLYLRKPLSSNNYWNQRYVSGHHSGPGSYGRLAVFKSTTLNEFVAENDVSSIIEFGSGDGNQLSLAQYPTYTGYDVSRAAVAMCRERFLRDNSKQFFHTGEYDGQQAELAVSLDVIFHLIEDEIFDFYMHRLFDASSRFVAIYSSNQDNPVKPIAAHVRHRQFSRWIDKNLSHWKLAKHIPNPYPYNGDSTRTSFADFYFYEKD